MAWRRRGRFTRSSGARTFRRRTRSDLLPISFCQQFQGVDPAVEGQDCGTRGTDPFPGTIRVVPFPNLQGDLGDTAVLENTQLQKLSRGLKFRGMQFDLNVTNGLLYGQMFNGVGLLVARAAVVKIERSPDTGAPAEIPNLFSIAESDKTDILWRAQYHIPWSVTDQVVAACDSGLGLDCPNNFGQDAPFQSRIHQRIKIRTRRNLKETEGLFFVWHVTQTSFLSLGFVSDLFGFAEVKNWA